MERPTGFDAVQRPAHYNKHPSGVECIEIAEYMGFNLGNAFKYLWRAGLKQGDCTQDLEKALWYLRRFDEQRAPLPHVPPDAFREIMSERRRVFAQPSPWPFCTYHALSTICDIAASPSITERARLNAAAINFVEQAIGEERNLGRGLEA
jgi:hypothetical protein